MKYNHKRILIKYGGNAMNDPDVQKNIALEISTLHKNGVEIVLVHGGGPEIARLLKTAGIQSEFIAGQRKTDEQAITYVEMALKGSVNSQLVRLLNQSGIKAVGLTGKDAKMVKAVKRFHIQRDAHGHNTKIDLGLVGNVQSVDCTLINILMDKEFMPVIAPLGWDENGQTLNINADVFAGHIAGALQVDLFLLLTDTDGLLRDRFKSETLIKQITINEISALPDGIISEGMLPKIESAITAVQKGVKNCFIINGTKTGEITKAINNQNPGTQVKN